MFLTLKSASDLPEEVPTAQITRTHCRNVNLLGLEKRIHIASMYSIDSRAVEPMLRIPAQKR